MKRYTVQANQFNLATHLDDITRNGHEVVEIFSHFIEEKGAFIFLILAIEPLVVSG